MLNFRKLRQDFSSNILKEGKELFDKACVVNAKILHFDGRSIRLSSRVRGAFDHVYESEIEIDRNESVAVDSNCDCTYTYDCQHIAAFLFYLEENLNQIVVAYSHETDLDGCEKIDDAVKKSLRQTFEVAASKEDERKDLQCQKEILSEYVGAAKELGSSPFFLMPEQLEEDSAELAIILMQGGDIQLALRLPSRSKPLYVPHIKGFIEAVRYQEPITLGGRKYCFTMNSFNAIEREIVALVMQHARFYGGAEEKYQRVAQLEHEALGMILARAYDVALSKGPVVSSGEKDPLPMPCLYCSTLEEPLCYSTVPVQIQFKLEYLESPGSTLLLRPSLVIEEECVNLEDVPLYEATKTGLIFRNTYYRFSSHIKRTHLRCLPKLRDMTIPEPLFGTFIENALPTLRGYAEVTNLDLINRFVTLPYAEEIKGRCVIHYLNGELEAELFFIYAGIEIPAAHSKLTYKDIVSFVGNEGVIARNLVEERKLIETIFEDFLYDEKEGIYRVKSEKKIVEFMTEIIPRHQNSIAFECPENLSEQFIYDDTTFDLKFKESDHIDSYEVDLKVNGYLKGTSIDLLWECVASKKRFVELYPNQKAKKIKGKMPRILVLELEKIAPLVQIFDEIGIKMLDDHTERRPLWSLTSVNANQFASLPVTFSMSQPLQEIQQQIFGEKDVPIKEIPTEICAELRRYQIEGVHWLERLRQMHLNGILADDMGLGKTLQTIIAVTQSKKEKPDAKSLIVCPTSLLYNWKEEFHKFNPELKVLIVDSIPSQRRKLLQSHDGYDVVITSYNLLQKDIEFYKEIQFDYAVLDEAQHIKNRGTRNARSVKMIRAAHRLILTGTPIENSLEELWSLFDFLMPGLLSSYDRFVEKYIRNCGHAEEKAQQLDLLKKKVSPFILRRMKGDVLEDLPPVSEILYHCHLSERQQELYHSYAASAKEELSRLVKKEGFEKIHIHVLATLTRLKQICCHPAIFAKEKAEAGDSAKYDMLMELIPSLIESNHKVVIFSQYTKMLSILREDLNNQGIPFVYLDGSSKNRLGIVKQFNEDPNIPIFLVSLKAGGSGLNLVGADTVVHYDMWWNPAVENQATDRVHRIGQKRSVSSYKLITLNTIEEKILKIQKRKKGWLKKVISTDDDAISKLTWEEVLEILQT